MAFDFKKLLDIKTIFILVLAAALVISIIFRRSKEIDNYISQKEQLAKDNKKLQNEFDSIAKVNVFIEKYRKTLADSMIKVNAQLADNVIKIKDLEKRKNENHKIVNNLNANGVADEFAKYFNSK